MNLKQFILIVLLHLCNASRDKRSLPFIRGSAFGYLAAIAIPVDLTNRNIFLAFNFEANYALPWNETHKDFNNKWTLDGPSSNTEKNEINPINLINKRSVYTRNNFYNGILSYIKIYEKNSVTCLQRFICEIAQSSLDKNNGIIGSLFKVLFLPSTSNLEKSVSDLYYEAEEAGISGNCSCFSNLCSTSFLDILLIA